MKAALVGIVLLLIGCTGEDHVGFERPRFGTITCIDAKGIEPDKNFVVGDPNMKVICVNNICFPTATSPISDCLYDCGQAQRDAGMFSPCWAP